MFDEEDSELGVAIGVVFGIIALVIALVIGVGTYQLRGPGAITQVAAAGSDRFTADELYVELDEVGEPLVKIYFDLGQRDLPQSAAADVATVVAALQQQPAARALLSGFHDESGTAEVNAAIAAERALAVREALFASGISAERVLLRRPAVTLGEGDAAEARRVEIRIQ